MGRPSKGTNIERPIGTHVPPEVYKWLDANRGNATISAYVRSILIANMKEPTSSGAPLP